MKIAQVSPLVESVPPIFYGGTERVVSYLTEELVEGGHDVTLFASGDSRTSAQLIPVVHQALRLQKVVDYESYHLLLLEEIIKRANEYDMIHFHIDHLHFPLARLLQLPQVTTLHGRLDLPSLHDLYREFNDMPVVSISDNQRIPLNFANWQATVYNGVPEKKYTFYERRGDYLAFLGRISPDKGLESAILIAMRSGMPLKIAAKLDPEHQDYFNERIKPLLKHPLIEYLGEINESEKNNFLGNAFALLFPIKWPEPFGMVIIEAMACGTPTIAFRHGSVPEIITHGETGFIVDNIEQAIDSVEATDTLSRACCRHIFEARFTAKRMMRDYLATYYHLLEQNNRHQLIA